MEKINITEKLRTFDKFWQSKLIGEYNDRPVKIIKLKGDFDWHHHKDEDEMLLVLKGQVKIEFQEDSLVLGEGDLFIIPCNAPHKLVATDEVNLLMIEPKSTLNTQNHLARSVGKANDSI